ncbi:ATP phosphoribosyltransferase [Rhodobacteraceae bacterium NNCM2]|nr:ATP phosphoribosyltransferase [Coraliihabitans acroporae]
MALVLGLPSKGRLMAATIDWFAAHGISIEQVGMEREYKAAASGLDGLEIVMLSAGEIPRELATGRIHLGVTGEDMIRERIPASETRVESLAKLGFGDADLVIAIPDFWLDVETMSDLDAVCDDFRTRHGSALRVATKYHNLTRAWFKKHGIADYRLVDSQGATEAGPANLTCEVICDITSTGATLRANHLRVMEDGPILRSTANLWRSLDAPWDAETEEVLAAFRERIGS